MMKGETGPLGGHLEPLQVSQVLCRPSAILGPLCSSCCKARGVGIRLQAKEGYRNQAKQKSMRLIGFGRLEPV